MRMMPRLRSIALCSLFAALASREAVFADDVKAGVSARSAKADQLADESKEARAAWQSSDAMKKVSEAEKTYDSQEAPLLADSERREREPDALLAAEVRNLAIAQAAISSILGASPEAQRLVALGDRATALRKDYAEIGKQLDELGKVMLRSADNGVNIGKLEATQQRLKARIQALTGTVAAEKDPTIKAHNEGILNQASALLSGLDSQISELKASLAQDEASAVAATGEADLAAAREAAVAWIAQWNRASRQIQDAAVVGANIVDARDVPPGLPKSVDDAVAGGFSTAREGVRDRVRKGFEAVMTHDWNLAKAWFGDALNHDPANVAVRRFVALADENASEAKPAAASEAAPAQPLPSRVPQDSDLELLFPGIAESDAKAMDDYFYDQMLKMTENDPELIRLSHMPPRPAESRDTGNPYEIHN